MKDDLYYGIVLFLIGLGFLGIGKNEIILEQLSGFGLIIFSCFFFLESIHNRNEGVKRK